MKHSDSEVAYWASELGPHGPGFVVCNQLLETSITEGIVEELTGPSIDWAVSEDSTDQLGNPVTQTFEVFAQKLSRGDQEGLQRMPNFRALGDLITKDVVQPLTAFFKSLSTWQPDEITAQRYRNQVGRLSWHRDLERHPGIIAVSNIVGSAELSIRQHMQTHTLALEEGDVILLRAPLLFDEQPVGSDIRPQHAVTSVGVSKDRISVTVRANSHPGRKIRNFHYNNWE